MFGEITLLMVLQGAALVAAGAAAGYFLALNNFDKQRDKLKDELERARAELKEQREKVDNHFLKTAQLFNRLTDDYREIYEHLATGAQTLCSPQIGTPQLDQPETRVLPAIEGSATESKTTGDSEKTAADSPKPDAGTGARATTSRKAKDGEKTATEAEPSAPETTTEQKAASETPPAKASGKPGSDDASLGADATPAPTAVSEEKPATKAAAAPAAGEKEEEKPATEASPAAETDEEKPITAAKAATDVDRHKSPPSIH